MMKETRKNNKQMIAQQICHVSLYVLHQYACAVCTCKYMYKERKMLFSNKDFFSFNHMHVCKPLIVKYRWIVDLCQYLSHFKNPKFVLIYHLHFFFIIFYFFYSIDFISIWIWLFTMYIIQGSLAKRPWYRDNS